jgi:hypothetical protein
MKRILMAAVLVVAAVLPATSSAGAMRDGQAAERGGQDLSISFTLRSVDGVPAEVRKFKFKNLTATCNVGGPIDVNGNIGGSMAINNKGKFDGKVTNGDAKVVVEGEVKRGGAKVKGTIKAKGDFPPAQGCNSGRVKWEAS